MATIEPRKTPEDQADWLLSNYVLEGSKKRWPDGTWVTQDEHGNWRPVRSWWDRLRGTPAPKEHRR